MNSSHYLSEPQFLHLSNVEDNASLMAQSWLSTGPPGKGAIVLCKEQRAEKNRMWWCRRSQCVGSFCLVSSIRDLQDSLTWKHIPSPSTSFLLMELSWAGIAEHTLTHTHTYAHSISLGLMNAMHWLKYDDSYAWFVGWPDQEVCSFPQHFLLSDGIDVGWNSGTHTHTYTHICTASHWVWWIRCIDWSTRIHQHEDGGSFSELVRKKSDRAQQASSGVLVLNQG